MKSVIKNILEDTRQKVFNLETDHYDRYGSFSGSFREPTVMETVYMVELFKKKDWEKLKSGDLIMYWAKSIILKGFGLWTLKTSHVNTSLFFMCPKGKIPYICGWNTTNWRTDVSARVSKKDRILGAGDIEHTSYKNMEFIEDDRFFYRLNRAFERLDIETRMHE